MRDEVEYAWQASAQADEEAERAPDASPRCPVVDRRITTPHLHQMSGAEKPDGEGPWYACGLAKVVSVGQPDLVNHPPHYTAHPSGVECIEISEALSFCLGNALKYIWRAGQKEGVSREQDIRKAIWYLRRESERQLHDKRQAHDGIFRVMGEEMSDSNLLSICKLIAIDGVTPSGLRRVASVLEASLANHSA